MTPTPTAMNRHVAYLTSHYARAGDTFIRREVEELRRLGWTVSTFSVRRPEAGEGVAEDILREQRQTDYILEHGAATLIGAFLRTAVRSPARTLRALRVAWDLRAPGLRSLLWHGFYLLEASYLAERLAERGVALLHDHIAMSSATVAMLASTLSGVPFSMTVHGLELLAAEQWALAAKIGAAAATVCVSSHGRAQCMLFSSPGDWDRLHEVRCGLDADYLAGSFPPPPDNARLVCVGRLSPEKGQLLLVSAAARLRQRGVPVELVLVGDGPSRPEIERRVRELGVTDAVRLVGWQSSADVRRWISESRALVVPSFSEGIPVVVMEAMALQRPVLATHVGGIPELVRPGENGWLVPAGSVDELADAMVEVLGASVERLEEMGRLGRRRVLVRHDLSAEVRRLATLFEAAVAGRTADAGPRAV